ncbi:MAG: tryptophan-rich sensory protein [Candidatus Liptonbacteria bacterium]|nr:tryptophan-rich sensory protein [Candidatus Liptonbacteria bacterium]
MKPNNLFKFVIAVAISESAAVIGYLFTAPAILSGWYSGLEKPAFTPPDWMFGPAWTVLYLLIGISLFLVWKSDWKVVNPVFVGEKKAWNSWSERLWTGDLQKFNVIAIFASQYVLNVLWVYIFFGLRLPGLAFFEILALLFAIFYLIVNFYRISKPAAYLLIPYFVWIFFAAYLNFSTWSLNPAQDVQKACTMEAKLCSDGTTVGRSGPRCEFAACPKENLIRVESPGANETVSSPLTVRGNARGNWFFEASFPVKILDVNGNLVATSIAQAQSDWMTTEFVPFNAVIEFEKPTAGSGFLVLEKDNPSGLPEHSDELRVPILFSGQ